MTRVKRKQFFELFEITCNEENITRYKNGWTLQEIKEGKEFRQLNYEKEVKEFKKTII